MYAALALCRRTFTCNKHAAANHYEYALLFACNSTQQNSRATVEDLHKKSVLKQLQLGAARVTYL